MKKIINFLLALILCFGSVAKGEYTETFCDIDKHWAENDIDTIYELGAYDGVDSYAYPDEQISRATFVELCIRALYGNDTKENKSFFDDVDPKSKEAPYISYAYKNGIINGKEKGKFCPESKITRGEIAIIVSRMKILKKSDKFIKFDDVYYDDNYPFKEEINDVASNGIFEGYTSDIFRPHKNMTIAEAITIMSRILRCETLVSESVAENELRDFANKYFESDINYADNFAENNSVGCAKKDIAYRNHILNSTMASDIKRMAYDKTITKCETKGMLSTVSYKAKIDYINDDFKKTYNLEVTYDIVYRNGKMMTYNTQMYLLEDAPIISAWRTFSGEAPKTSEYMTHIILNSYVLSKADDVRGEKYDFGNDIKMYTQSTKDVVDGYHNNEGFNVWAMYKPEITHEETATLLSNMEFRDKLVKRIINDCVATKMTGLNFDFEKVRMSEESLFSDHVREMTLAMHLIGGVVSVDVGVAHRYVSPENPGIDHDRLTKYTDYLILLAYDQYYSGSKEPGPVSSLDWTKSILEKTLEQTDHNRFILGIPFYVKHWKVDSNGNIVFARSIASKDINDYIPDKGVSYDYIEKDSITLVTWYDDEGLKNLVWMEDVATVKKRAKMINKYELAGISAWRLNQEPSEFWDVIAEYVK